MLNYCKQLRLSGLINSLDIRLQEANGNALTHEEFLELILQDEVLLRKERRIQRRLKQASFPALKTIEDFNFDFNREINRRQIYDFTTCQFIDRAEDILFIGPPGVGKTHLATAIGYQAIKQNYLVRYTSIFDLVRDFMQEEATNNHRLINAYLKADLLIIDDMGLKQLPNRAGEYIFEIIMRRYTNRSTIMTSNRPIEEWGKLINDVPTASAILDRFLHHTEVITIYGKSYRMNDRQNTLEKSEK